MLRHRNHRFRFDRLRVARFVSRRTNPCNIDRDHHAGRHDLFLYLSVHAADQCEEGVVRGAIGTDPADAERDDQRVSHAESVASYLDSIRCLDGDRLSHLLLVRHRSQHGIHERGGESALFANSRLDFVLSSKPADQLQNEITQVLEHVLVMNLITPGRHNQFNRFNQSTRFRPIRTLYIFLNHI